ncbi:MAG TPA: alcohol dehydrogenase catalytic domain-containing protein [Thermodesulfobacteriota bacterium]|nr:alcohol dehydrogenase catalytic domain-containing protein [Thermodesulfobacteriota bacterium]
MKRVVIEKPGSFRIGDFPDLQPGEEEVTLDVKACCVCGTDIHLLDGEFKGAEYPLIPGHEFSGTVREVGPKVSHVKPGDRAAVEPFIACGYCFFCKAGKINHCRNGMVIGHTRSKSLRLDGGFSEQVVVPAKNLVPLADTVSFEAGSFIANIGTILYALRRTGIDAGVKVLVFGTGANGLIMAELAKKSGAATVVVTGRTKSRLDVARRMGIDETVLADDRQEENLRRIAPRGFEVIFETTGAVPIVEKAFRFAAPAGKIVLYGIVPPDQNASINPFDICRRDLQVIGSFSSVHTCIMAQELLASGALKVDHLISHRFKLEEWAKAIQTARDPGKCMRSIVLMN